MKKLTISEVGSLIAVSIPTLRRWDRGGFLTLDFLTTGCHKRYSLDKVKSFRELGAVEASPEAEKPVVLYSRVSSSKQKGLTTQISALRRQRGHSRGARWDAFP